MTFKFFSVDNAGNAEAVQTQTVQVQANPDPIIGSAGDIACDPTAAGFNNGLGFGGDCVAASTASLLTGIDAVLPLGDDQYNCGGVSAFEQAYGPAWGVKRSITYPVPGDKDWTTSGGTDCPATPGAGYQQYFSSSGGVFGSALPSAVNVSDTKCLLQLQPGQLAHHRAEHLALRSHQPRVLRGRLGAGPVAAK